MNKELKTFAITLALAGIVLWITRPKWKTKDEPVTDVKYQEPKVAKQTDVKARENAIIAMQAMKDAIAKKESVAGLEELKKMIFEKYKIKILINKSTKKLRAVSESGETIAEEE